MHALHLYVVRVDPSGAGATRDEYQQALADTAGLVNKARNGSVRFPAAIVTEPENRTLYGRTEQILQELHLEPRLGILQGQRDVARLEARFVIKDASKADD